MSLCVTLNKHNLAKVLLLLDYKEKAQILVEYMDLDTYKGD